MKFRIPFFIIGLAACVLGGLCLRAWMYGHGYNILPGLLAVVFSVFAFIWFRAGSGR